VKVDLRVVAATNQDLERMVAAGAFREDLFYRLNVLRIDLPTLAERAEDVPALAEHLLLDIARRNGLPALGFTPAALEALTRHRWPGNVRELRNAVERAFLGARGRRIDVSDLPGAVQHPGAPAPLPDEPGDSLDPGGAPLTLEAVEQAHIERVLRRAGWNRSLAARLLGIDRRTLFAKIKRYGLVGPLRAGPGGGVEDEDDGPPA
jgi:DNA-binding NtrC family response regulator